MVVILPPPTTTTTQVNFVLRTFSSTLTGLKPNSITLVGSEMVRSWFEPDSEMEFGFYSGRTERTRMDF